jgi:apolipoprotein N-acyltransferase
MDTKLGRALLLGLGALLVFAANLRWSVGVLAWVAPVPLLHVLRLRPGWRSRGWVLLALAVGWCAATWKITTAPLPSFFALLGVQFALFAWAPLLVWDRVRRRSETLAPLAYGAAVVVAEFLQPRLTPLATWGSVAFTQLDDLPFLQLAALTGAGGISFLVACTGAALEGSLAPAAAGNARRSARRVLVGSLAAVALAHVAGAARLAIPLPRETVTIATVGTTLDFGPSTPFPGPEERARALDLMLDDTRTAARAGAGLVVWTEASELVLPEEEAEVGRRIAATARELGVQVVAGYIVPLSTRPLLYENVLLWVAGDGTVLTRYLKHRPAPGEPAVRGTGRLPVHDTALGRLGAALCYDEDYPDLAHEQGRAGVDLVALPSSDWRGIDPIHTQMAALRAVENGMSIVRSTRWGLSAGIDPLGRLRASQSSFEAEDRILRVSLPRHRLFTPYAVVGDVVVWAAGLFLLGLGAAALRARLLRRPGAVPAPSQAPSQS